MPNIVHTFHHPKGSVYEAAPAPSPDRYLWSSDSIVCDSADESVLGPGANRSSTSQTSSRNVALLDWPGLGGGGL